MDQVTLNLGEYWTESRETVFENVNNFPPATICGPLKTQRRSPWQMLLAGLTNMSHREHAGDNNEICVFTGRRGTQVSESLENACFRRLSQDQHDISITSVTPQSLNIQAGEGRR